MSSDTLTSHQPEAPRLREQDLEGKVAVVTKAIDQRLELLTSKRHISIVQLGATKGIGRAIALNLASRGASILGTYSSPESAHHLDTLSHTVSALYNNGSHGPKGPKVTGIAANLLSPSSSTDIAAALEKEFDGHVDILVNNAAHIEGKVIGEMTPEYVHKMLLGNIEAPVLLVNELVKRNMFRPNSRIVNISADRVRAPVPGGSLYTAAKAALEALVRSWAVELGTRKGMEGTTANAVCVGLINSHFHRTNPPERLQALKKERLPRQAVGSRIGECEDISDIVGFLCGESSRWVTGSVMSGNGGAEMIY
ncbi:hypothetical protein B0A49_07958 [Cryomyces minteri]|uniref:Ketoreductase (KR) domain-containing protein n=1 Tax=Cryomyces minteri TaxID=331657 RepID=A0A4V5NDZ4_9PEZI|nr:hypothetical protein B0A49_07958 [Cryomyces minteri]